MATLPTPKDGILQMIKDGLTEEITLLTTPDEIMEISAKRVSYLWDKVNSPTNNPLMLLQSEKNLLPNRIIYFHKDKDGKVMYIGEGDMGRAGDAVSRRDTSHATWMLKQLFDKHDYISILETGLTKAQAKARQDRLIAEHNPIFNKTTKD